MKHNFIYTVRTRSGLTFHVEASNSQEAQQRAEDPVIGKIIANMLREALGQIDSVEPHRGPERLAQNRLVFRDDIFSHN